MLNETSSITASEWTKSKRDTRWRNCNNRYWETEYYAFCRRFIIIRAWPRFFNDQANNQSVIMIPVKHQSQIPLTFLRTGVGVCISTQIYLTDISANRNRLSRNGFVIFYGFESWGKFNRLNLTSKTSTMTYFFRDLVDKL